jgi:hypothetical protein
MIVQQIAQNKEMNAYEKLMGIIEEDLLQKFQEKL